MKRHRLHTSLLQVLGPASQIPSPMKVSNMANGRFIICLDLPRTVSIYAKKDNHSCSQPAHIFWTHLALPLLLPALQHLLLTHQNTVYPPTSVHVHCSFIEGYFPLPIYLFLLLFVLQSQLKYHLLREIASSLPDRDDRPLVTHSFMFLP